MIEGLEHEIIGFKDNIQNPSMKMLISEYEKALVEIGWNPDEKIKITKRGEYKTSSPFQCCLKNRVAVLKRAYDYFYSGKNMTLEA